MESLENRVVPAMLDLTTAGAAGTINGASFEQADPQPTGVGVINDFLRIQSHGDSVEQGYNSDVRPVQFDEKTDPPHNRSFHLSELPTVNISGTSYRVILLGINQRHSDPQLSLDELRLYVSASGTVSGYNASTLQLGGLSPVYDLGANWIKLDSSLSHGNGSGDMFAFVPDRLFALPGGPADPFVYLYSKFGVHFGANGGFEQRAPGTGVTLPAPASVSGVVFLDVNQDGRFDSGDSGIGNVTLTLTGTNLLGQQVSLTTTTAANGSYIFDGLLPGTYQVTESPPVNFVVGQDSVGTVNGQADGSVLSNTSLGNIVLQAGQAGINYDFGNILPNSGGGPS
jgi:hypothetical protein